MNITLKKIPIAILLLSFMFSACHRSEQSSSSGTSKQLVSTYTNPLLPEGAEPWAIYHNGYYYYTQGMDYHIVVWKTKDITDLRHAEKKEVWLPDNPKMAQHLWGPEIHFLNGKWYIYYVADDGNTDNHQIYVLENPAKDPFQGKFAFKGHISTDKGNNWAIHPDVIEHNGSLYMTWSGWQTRRVNVEHQCIYIAKMKNPWTLASDRVLLSQPELEWERQWINPDGSKTAYTIYVNEAPQFFHNKNGDKIYIFYSASGTWTPFYAIGMLTANANSNLLDPKSWTKSQRPAFKQSPKDSVFSTGNCCFIPSPDGKEYYLLYHARSIPNDPPGALSSRAPRLQKIGWAKDGTPLLGKPVSTKIRLPKPSGLK